MLRKIDLKRKRRKQISNVSIKIFWDSELHFRHFEVDGCSFSKHYLSEPISKSTCILRKLYTLHILHIGLFFRPLLCSLKLLVCFRVHHLIPYGWYHRRLSSLGCKQSSLSLLISDVISDQFLQVPRFSLNIFHIKLVTYAEKQIAGIVWKFCIPGFPGVSGNPGVSFRKARM